MPQSLNVLLQTTVCRKEDCCDGSYMFPSAMATPAKGKGNPKERMQRGSPARWLPPMLSSMLGEWLPHQMDHHG